MLVRYPKVVRVGNVSTRGIHVVHFELVTNTNLEKEYTLTAHCLTTRDRHALIDCKYT